MSIVKINFICTNNLIKHKSGFYSEDHFKIKFNFKLVDITKAEHILNGQ